MKILILNAPKNIAADFLLRHQEKGYSGEVVRDGDQVSIELKKETK